VNTLDHSPQFLKAIVGIVYILSAGLDKRLDRELGDEGGLAHVFLREAIPGLEFRQEEKVRQRKIRVPLIRYSALWNYCIHGLLPVTKQQTSISQYESRIAREIMMSKI